MSILKGTDHSFYMLEMQWNIVSKHNAKTYQMPLIHASAQMTLFV